ncbi:hypothetical protein [Streptococcus mutans]|uniref:hypothetical protein n=1 Tax=Streptococcus mutans TaxID=1309 RepID=UPI0029892EE1|nr:hypothetical protein [Streptococcus mutans]MDW5565753.1 hypothetical protein [Streptococcus mutans]
MEIDGLAENTFGYFLGDENERERIKELFDLVRDKIITSSVTTEILSKNSIIPVGTLKSMGTGKSRLYIIL